MSISSFCEGVSEVPEAVVSPETEGGVGVSWAWQERVGKEKGALRKRRRSESVFPAGGIMGFWGDKFLSRMSRMMSRLP